MPQVNTQVYTGNIVEITFDGVVVGMCQSLRASEDTGLQEVSGIGNAKATEYVPSLIRYTVTASFLQMRTQSVEAVSGVRIANRTANDALSGLVFDIIVRNKAGQMLKRFVSCNYGSGDLEVNKHAIVGRNITFMALDQDGDFLGNTFSGN